MMRVGYARTSTLEQKAGIETQLRELEAAGCQKIFKEQVSSMGSRSQLAAALDFIREGDTLIITKLDRLAPSVAHTEAVKAKGAHLQVLAMGLNTADATGRLMLNVIGSVAQFEREMMLEWQREGSQRLRPTASTRAEHLPRARRRRRSARFGPKA
jgi:DNA invertase Pin-like site-specific DNA recombinase